MKIRLLKYSLVVGLMALGSTPVKAVQESDFIAILQSSAAAPAKCAACQQLRIHGTVQSVPALAGLLGHERVGHAARYALEGMPHAEAGAALRDALARTSGQGKAGLADSLGWRRDRVAVPLLIALLSDQDAQVAAAAAIALGKIAGPEAVRALEAVPDSASPQLRQASWEALLNCAEARLKTGDRSAAASLYRRLFSAKTTLTMHSAAWRGLVLSDEDQCAKLILAALKGSDLSLKQAALKLVRELRYLQLILPCLQQWDTLDAASQLAVLDAHLGFGAAARDTVRRAGESPKLMLRVAAWQAMAEIGDPAMIPALVRAAAQGETAERDAARDTLTRVHGPGVQDALVALLQDAQAPEKAELLLALGQRGDKTSVPILLQCAEAPEQPVRLAALNALRGVGRPETLLPLLDLAVTAPSTADRSAALKALFALCQVHPDKAQAGRQILAALRDLPAAERGHVLPLLGELATPEALVELRDAAQDADATLVRESIRVMTQWPNAAPVPCLLDLARTHKDTAIRILALRGAITVAGREAEPTQRLAFLQKAIKLAQRDEEKRLALSQLAQIAQAQALDIALSYLQEPALSNEAGLAALGIAESLAKADPKLGDEMARKVLEHAQTPAIVKRAWALRVRPAARGPFIRDWLVCGPYRQAGASGALPLFDIKFGPETPDETVKWYAARTGDTVPLAALFPGQANCVAYLKAEITAPQATDAILLMGSDDGIKAWLNGTVVHSNNIDRGQVADQDVAPIKLKQGANELLLKITQGGGGWSACARIVGAHGLPIKGLRIKSQEGTAPPVSEHKTPAVQ